MVAFADGVVEAFLEVVAAVLLDIAREDPFVLLQEFTPAAVLHETGEGFIARHPVGGQPEFIERVGRGLLVVWEVLEFGFRFDDEACGQAGLEVNDHLDLRDEAHERRFAFFGDWTGDDQRRAGFVDEDGVDFVDDAEVVLALHLFAGSQGHPVIAQVIEAELGRSPVGDIAGVGLLAFLVAHLVLDATDGEPEPAQEVPHPFGVAAGEVVIDRDQLAIAARERVQVKGQGGDEGFPFAGRHFGDLLLVEGDAADELDVEMHHLPGLFMVADDGGRAAEAAGGVLDHGERFGEEGVEGLALGEAGLELGGLAFDGIVGQALVLQFVGVDLFDQRGALAEESPVMAASEKFEDTEKHGSGRERVQTGNRKAESKPKNRRIQPRNGRPDD